jgi:photosystem II stability/assembly factor-like uncharacterized protein
MSPISFLGIKRLFVALGSLLFADGAFSQMINWTSNYAPDYAEIREVAYGNGLYVAVGDNNAMFYSGDGVNWQNGSLPAGASYQLKAVAYAFGQFFAGGAQSTGGKGVLLISIDGVEWTDITAEFPSDDILSSVNELFAASPGGQESLLACANFSSGSYDYENRVFVTPDGTSWAPSSAYYGTSARGFFQDGSSVIGISSGYYVSWGKLTSSSSGTSFSSLSGFPTALGKFAFGNRTYVGVGSARKLAYFTSGVSTAFTYATSPLVSDYTGIAFGRDTFVAVGSNGAVVISYDLGRKWHAVTGLELQQVTMNGVRFVGGKFIAFGGSRIVTGEPINKRFWQASTLPNGTPTLSGIATNGQDLVAVGAKGYILHSTDGITWQRTAPVTSRSLNRVDYDSATKTFYATGENGTLLRSGNGRNWTAASSGYSGYLQGVGRSGGRLIAGGGTSGAFIFSADGRQWRTGNTSLLNFGRSISDAGNGQVFAYGASGRVARTSNGGVAWQGISAPANTTLYDMTVYSKNIFLAGGNGSLYRAPLNNPSAWTPVSTWTILPFLGLPRNAQAAGQLAAVGLFGAVYSQPSSGGWRLELLDEGAPVLTDIVKHRGRWVIVGTSGENGYAATTTED